MDPNVQAILASVQAFYSTAWSQLVVYTTALLALVGILVPVLSQWYQRKSAAVDKKELEGLLRDQVDHARGHPSWAGSRPLPPLQIGVGPGRTRFIPALDSFGLA